MSETYNIKHIISYIEDNNIEAVYKLVYRKGQCDGDMRQDTRYIYDTDDKGRTALHWAVKYNRLNMVQLLVRGKDADINAEDKKGLTPLHLAARYEHLEIFEYLVEQEKAEVNTNDEYGTLLHTAINWGNLEVIQFLIKKNVDVNNEDMRWHNYGTPLELAVRNKNFYYKDPIPLLVKAGAIIKSNLVHDVARLGYVDTMRCFVEEANLDIETKNYRGETILFSASESVAKYLIKKGAKTNAKDKYGRTPLFKAVTKRGGLETVKHLIEVGGADVYAKDDNDTQLLHQVRCLEIAKYLVEEKGLDVNAITMSGITPLDAATSRFYGYKDIDLVRYLVEKGAHRADRVSLDLNAIENKINDTQKIRNQLQEIIEKVTIK